VLLRTLAFLAGIITLSFQSQLLPLASFLVLILFTPLLLFRKKIIILLFWYSAGFIWATVIAYYSLSNKIPTELEGKDIVVTGVISTIPEKIGRRTRFELVLDSVIYKNKSYISPRKIRLNWYGKSPILKPDDKWQLVVRLKKPFGYQNSGGFDYEAWMFQNKIDAKGYVRKSKLNILLQENKSWLSFTRARYELKQKIHKINHSVYRSIILALLIGDKSEIKDKQWQVFRKTGTSHLIAISGLHIGLIAGLVFFMSRWLWGFYSNGVEIIPSPKVAALCAIVAAVIYSALAGFSLPTQRALIMLCVIMVSILFDIRAQSWKTLSIALLLVLVLSPFSVMNPGFWLSFCAVGIILYFSKMKNISELKFVSTLYSWSLIQIVIAVGLIPFVLLFFGETSIISPIANFIIVPVFSFIVVPITFIAGCILFVSPTVSGLLFSVVVFVLDKTWIFLEYLATLNFSTVRIDFLSNIAFVLACVGVTLIFLPKKFPAKYLTPIFFLPLLFFKPESPEFGTAKMTLLDVGQGLAVVIQTEHHVLVFDTGPRFSNSFNTGKTVVVPFLKSKGISQVNYLIISHGDNDHIGGVKSVVDLINVNSILTSVPTKVVAMIKSSNQKVPVELCNSDLQWHWDGVEFRFIHPSPQTTLKDNDASCVLQISSGQNTILLTGDIEAKAEQEIVDDSELNSGLNLLSTILVAPHHGSKTSSTQLFLDKVRPKYVLYAVGYRNRYRFPADVVSKRYKNLGAIEYSTSNNGAIVFILSAKEIKKPELYRESHRRFWHN